MDKSWAVWFEIPVIEMERAKKFYETIFGFEMATENMQGSLMAFFPMEGYSNSGALVKYEGAEPGDKGVLTYLYGGEDLSGVLDKVEAGGGKVIVPKTLVTEEIGYIGIFIDTEGNKVGLWSKG